MNQIFSQIVVAYDRIRRLICNDDALRIRLISKWKVECKLEILYDEGIV